MYLETHCCFHALRTDASANLPQHGSVVHSSSPQSLSPLPIIRLRSQRQPCPLPRWRRAAPAITRRDPSAGTCAPSTPAAATQNTVPAAMPTAALLPCQGAMFHVKHQCLALFQQTFNLRPKIVANAVGVGSARSTPSGSSGTTGHCPGIPATAPITQSSRPNYCSHPRCRLSRPPAPLATDDVSTSRLPMCRAPLLRQIQHPSFRSNTGTPNYLIGRRR